MKSSLAKFEKDIELILNPIEKFTLGAFDECNYLIGFVKFQRDNRSKARHRGSLSSLYVDYRNRKKGVTTTILNEAIKIMGVNFF